MSNDRCILSTTKVDIKYLVRVIIWFTPIGVFWFGRFLVVVLLPFEILTLFLAAVQRLTYVSGSCSGATAECTSVKSSLLMIWKGRTRPSWSYWCLVCLCFNQSSNAKTWKPNHDQPTCLLVWFHLSKSTLYFGKGFRNSLFVALHSTVSLQQHPWRWPNGLDVAGLFFAS